MPALKWTDPAILDLWAIDEWLDENASGEIALATLSAIRFRADFLEEFPHSGRPIDGGVRMLRVIHTPHLILYRLDGSSIEILRIRYEREDWQIES
jgi:plasmid stabilization system protein ParE